MSEHHAEVLCLALKDKDIFFHWPASTFDLWETEQILSLVGISPNRVDNPDLEVRDKATLEALIDELWPERKD